MVSDEGKIYEDNLKIMTPEEVHVHDWHFLQVSTPSNSLVRCFIFGIIPVWGIILCVLFLDSQLKACKEERRRVKEKLEEEKQKVADALEPVVQGKLCLNLVILKPERYGFVNISSVTRVYSYC